MQTKHTEALDSEKIPRLLLKLSIPSTAGMLAMSLYNLVDTIFVGRGVGSLAIGGLTVVMPLQMLIFAVAMTFGMGGSSVISRALGAKDNQRAQRTFGNLITLTFIMSFFILLLGYGFTGTVLFLFGGQGEILPYAQDYFIYILAGTPFLNFAMVFNAVIRSEGNAKMAMFTMVIAAVINIVLDPIFIFGLHMGVKGAAIASVISQVVTFIYIVYYFASGKSSFHFKPENLKPDGSVIREIFALGATSMGRHGAGSILAAILNHSLFSYGGGLAVAVYGIINRILRVVFMPMFGLVQAFMPVTGFNYGAKKYARVLETFKISNAWATYISIGLFLVMMIFAKPILHIFSNDAVLIERGTSALRLIMLFVPIVGFQIISTGYFQAIGKAVPSFFLAMSRQVLFLLPLILIMPLYFGLDGIWYSFPIADLLSVIAVTALIIPEIRLLKKSVPQTALIKSQKTKSK